MVLTRMKMQYYQSTLLLLSTKELDKDSFRFNKTHKLWTHLKEHI